MPAIVIIVNWNGKRFLSECLDGLRQQSYQQFSIISVDNGSNDGSIDFVIHNCPQVKTSVLPRNVGFAAANNYALKTIETEYVALLNNDAVPHSLWLKSLVEALESHPAWKMLFYDNQELLIEPEMPIPEQGRLFSVLGARLQAITKSRNGFFGSCASAALQYWKIAIFKHWD